MTKNVCRKFKFGHCKYGVTCKYNHIKEVCKAKNCNISDCEKRHPRICKFIAFYGRCKFMTYCDYSHEKQNDVKENSDKIIKLEKKLFNFGNRKEIPSDDDRANRVEKKIDSLENKMKTPVKSL